ncbi:MAG: aminotransferase class V-fold PLP-dependent enzyme [Ruminococcaceae bacterium]|nr:aminotransferase class V-fold PLP-dependent enzyme [Oscillospiraceae bacterium]
MIYFDSAATTFQKPAEVAESVFRAMQEMTSPGRGGYPAASKAAEIAFDCRTELQEMFDAFSPEQIVFTMNATHALNIAIKSLVSSGGRVIISGFEHNAVTRPLAAIQAKISVAEAPLFSPEETVAAFAREMTTDTCAVICSHVSNVFGYAQPVNEIGALCKELGIPYIIDASQSAGILPLSAEKSGASFIAMPGHKGLYGPQGTGVLICCPDAPIKPLLEGGTGSRSSDILMPEFLPDRLEAGTHNIPGIAGLLAGIRFVKAQGMERICREERVLAAVAAEGLRQILGIEVFAEDRLFAQTGVLSFRHLGIPSEILAERLAEKGVAVRSGLHCAPLAHKTADTLRSGTVRLSFSAFNTMEEVFRFLNIMDFVVSAEMAGKN